MYKTIAEPVEVTSRERGSRFLSYAYPVTNEEQIKAHLDELRKQYYDATHHCYAWRLGPRGERSRANDDGEPSGTAGKPILGQMLSHELTDILIVVVRYFGGTKLGVPGLIAAYKEGAQAAIEAARVIEKTVDVRLEVKFSYLSMNGVMKAVKELEPRIETQEFDNLCRMVLVIRQGKAEHLISMLRNVDGAEVEVEE